MGRPIPQFRGFIGKKQRVAQLRRQLEGAKAHGEPFPPVLFAGPSGVGKTLLARMLADEFGTSLMVINGNASPAELATNIRQAKAMDFLFIDECHNLSTKSQELLLLSRFVQVEVIPDVNEWLDWAGNNGIHNKVVRYVEADETVFDHPDSNPRAWTYISKLLTAAGDDISSGSALRAAVLGTVGDERGSAFLRFLKQPENPLNGNDIVENYDSHRASLKRWIETGRIDLVGASLRGLLKFLQPQEEYELVRQTPKQWKQLSAFIGDLPGDQRDTAQEFFQDRGYQFPINRRRRVTR